MSRLVASFDPSAGSGTFIAGAINRCSTLWVMNESPNFLALDFGGAGTVKIVQPWYNAQISLANPVNQVNWTVVATLQSGSAPVSMVYVELFDPAEDVSALTSGPLFRQSNVGNAAAVSASASAVQNDGNAANTTILEGTPSGAASSQALITNDGRAILGGGTVTISNAGIFTLPANAIPGASVSGAVTEAESLNNQVTSIDNGTAQLFSTVDGRGIALGYKDSGGTYHQVLTINTDGTVSAATLHGTADDAASATSAANLNGVFLAQFNGTIGGGGTATASVLETTQPASQPLSFAPQSWDGTTVHNAFSVGTSGFHAPCWIGDTGAVNPGNGGSLAGISHLSGSGSATVNHGLSVAPDAAVINNNAGTNSTTFGSGSYTATTVYIYQYVAMAWTGLAYKA